ncbi:hypothetical protein HID58_067713, partial [Brassica napus]
MKGNAQGKGNEKKKKMKGRTHNEVNNIEGKVAATEKGSSEEEGSKDLENKATLTTIVSTLENISRKFDQIDSWFDAYELERNRPLTDQKTIDDMVKALVEERLKVLGKIPENYDNLSNGGEEESLSLPSPQQKSINSPALVVETPGKVRGPKKNLAKELDKDTEMKKKFGQGDTWVKRTLAEEFDKDTWVKRNLAEEFGSVAKATDLNFVYVSPSKATKDDKDAKVPAYGRGCRGRRTVKDEDVADKKKA